MQHLVLAKESLMDKVLLTEPLLHFLAADIQPFSTTLDGHYGKVYLAVGLTVCPVLHNSSTPYSSLVIFDTAKLTILPESHNAFIRKRVWYLAIASWCAVRWWGLLSRFFVLSVNIRLLSWVYMCSLGRVFSRGGMASLKDGVGLFGAGKRGERRSDGMQEAFRCGANGAVEGGGC